MTDIAKPVSDKEARDKVWEMIKDIRIALMVTQDENGRLYGRPMAAHQEKFDNTLWFFTDKNSPKMQEIAKNPHVLLSYSDPSAQNYVSINGTARIVNDEVLIREYWSEHLRTWFPKGKGDPNIGLICVTPEQAEYWDSPSSTFLYAYGYAKAVLTGERPEGGENEKVNLQR
ncbi:MAG: ral stress protein [Alphaproteobacteria bacterium]|nr:ral stress protein [Alphaproteobacteria bacterium]